MRDNSLNIDQTSQSDYEMAVYDFQKLGFSLQAGHQSEALDVFLLDNQCDDCFILPLTASPLPSFQSLPRRQFEGNILFSDKQKVPALLILDCQLADFLHQYPTAGNRPILESGFQKKALFYQAIL